MSTNTTLKQRFLTAIIAGKLGTFDDDGVIVTQQEFRVYFEKEITTQYITSFLPAATIEKGRTSATHTHFLFRLRKGYYRVHPDAIDEAIELIIATHLKRGSGGDTGGTDNGSEDEPDDEPEDRDEPGVKESRACYG